MSDRNAQEPATIANNGGEISVTHQGGRPPEQDPAETIRELQESRRALEESEERYRALAEQVADGIFVTDSQGRYVDANEAACNMFGFTREELLRLSVPDLVSPEELSRLPEQWAQLVTGRVVQSDWTFRRKDGSCFIGDLVARGFPSGRFQGVVRDVTARREDERKLRELKNAQAFLLQLGDAIKPLTDAAAIRSTASHLLGSYLKANRVIYTEIDKDSAIVRCDYMDGLSSIAGRMPVGDFSEVISAYLAQKTIDFPDIPNEAKLSAGARAAYAAIGVVSDLGYGLIKDGSLVAALSIHQAKPRHWTELEKYLLEQTGERTWDAVERVRAEQALRASEQRFRAFVTATSDSIYRMSSDWTEMRHLDGRAFVADMENPTIDWLDTYIPKEDHEYVKSAIQEAIQTRAPFELQHHVVRADGTLGWTLSRAVPIVDTEGRLVEWLGAARDASRQKQAEQEIARLRSASEQSRRLYETILSSTPDLVYVFDLNHRFSYANKALLNMWGKTWDEAIGKNCLELGYEPWHAEMHDREIEQVIAGKQPIRGDVPFTGTNGRRIYDYIFVPVIGADGEVEAVAGTTRDVTERRQTEDELRTANESLEQFAYSASHDLQEPLRTISIYSQLVATRYRTNLDATALQYLTYLRSGAQRVEMLVHDLLAYTQVTRLDTSPGITDANLILSETLKNLEGTLAVSGARVTSDDLPAVAIHSIHLTQLLQNLIGNAIKYRSPDRTPEIHIAARRNDEMHDWMFSVRDNGIGIAPQYKESIFGLFKRLHAHDEYSGTGLGLAICQRIVDQYRGRIWVESVQGQGSTFFFTLPA